MTSTTEPGTNPAPPTDPNVLVLPPELIRTIKELHRHDAQHDAYEALAQEAKERMTDAYIEGHEKEAKLHRDQYRSLTLAAKAAREAYFNSHRKVQELRLRKFPGNTPCSLHTWTIDNEEGMHQLIITSTK